MPDDSRDYELIDQLAEEFAARYRKGERPSVQEYCDRYPKIADDLREMLPALAEVEHIKDEVQAPPAVEMPKLRQIGEYSILREVGRGGMGVVYEAEQVSLGRRVALKVLAGGKSGHGLERFKREARAAARLHHSNIVPVFGVGDYEGLPYYVMQFIQGLGVDEVLDEVKRLQAVSGTMVPPSSVSVKPPRKDVSAAAVARSLVTGKFEPPPEAFVETLTHAPVGQASRLSETNGQAGRLSHDQASSSSSISLPGQSNISGRKPTYWQSVAQIGLQVADALDYAHKQGILHRDIKPSNLLLDLHGVVWVTDFGLAKSDDQENLTNTGDMLGTLRYMPPEAFEGKNDARSDVYSLGLSLYELLALRPGYDERRREQLIKQVTTTDPPRLGSLNKAMPRDLQTVVHKAIEKDPSHRYQSAGDLAADLRRFLSDQPIQARRIHPIERFGRWCKRNPTVAGLSTAVFVLLISVAVVSAAMAVRIEGKAEEARFEANRANDETDRKNKALNDAALNLELAHVLVSEQFVHRGAQLLAEGDVSGAALCYARALKADSFDPERTLTHRIRLTAALREAARPQNILFHDSAIVCSAISPDGELFAAGCEDKSVYIWHLATGQRIGPALKHEHNLLSVAFAAGGKRIWTQTRFTQQVTRTVDSGFFYDDRDLSDSRVNPVINAVRLWDREEARIVFEGQSKTRTLDVIDPATNKGWVSYQPLPNLVETRDRDTGERIGPPIELPGESGLVATISPAQNRVVAYVTEVSRKSGRGASSSSGYVHHVYDARSAKHVFKTPRSDNSTAAICGTNDRFLIKSESDTGAVQWYDLATGEPGPRLAQPGMNTNVYAPSPDHRRLLATFTPRGLSNRQVGVPYHLLDADTGKQIGEPFTANTPDRFAELTPNRDATRFLVANGPSLRLLGGTGTSVADNLEGSTGILSIFSPDGGFLLTVGVDNTARVWDAWTGKPVTPRLPHDGPVKSAGFTPDGSRVFAISGSAAWLWPLARAEQGRGLVLANTPDARSLSADGSRVLEWPATPVGGTTARVLDSTTGQVVAGPMDLGPWRSDAPIAPVSGALRPDGRAAIFQIRGRPSSGGQKGGLGASTLTLLLWNCETGVLNELATNDLNLLGAAQFSRDGRYIRGSFPDLRGGSQHQLWDAATGAPIGPGVTVPAPRSTDDGFGTTTFGPPFRTPPRDGWSPDSSILACDDGDRANLHLYDPRTGETLSQAIARDPGREALMAYSQDSSRLLICEPVVRGAGGKVQVAPGPETLSGRVRLVETRTGRLVGAPLIGSPLGGLIVNSTLNAAGDRIAVVIAPTLASLLGRGAGDASGLGVYLWDPAAERLASPPLIHDQPVTHLAFSPDGQWLLTTTARHVRLWSVGTGELLHTLPTTDNIVATDFAQDGKRIVVSMNAQISTSLGGPGLIRPGIRGLATSQQVWDVRTGQPLTPILPVNGIARFAPGRPGGGGFSPFVGATGGTSANAEKLLISRDDGTPEVYSLVSDERPMAELMNLAELLSTRQVNTAGVVQGLGPAGFRSAWEANRPKLASEWSARSVEGSDWDRLCLPLRRVAALPVASIAQLRTLTPTERTGQFLWHLDRLLAAEPEDPGLHALRGFCLSAREEHATAEAEFTRAIELNCTWPLGLPRASSRCELSKWESAEADLIEYLKSQERKTPPPGVAADPAEARLMLALLRLKRNDVAGYAASARSILKSVASTQTPNFGVPTDLWATLLLDGANEGIEKLYPDVNDLSRGTGGPRANPFEWSVALRFRQGRYEDVLNRVNLTSLGRNRSDHYFVAMAQHKLGKTAEARATLENTLNFDPEPRTAWQGISPFTGSQPLSKWITSLVEETLRKEAEALILGTKKN